MAKSTGILAGMSATSHDAVTVPTLMGASGFLPNHTKMALGLHPAEGLDRWAREYLVDVNLGTSYNLKSKCIIFIDYQRLCCFKPVRIMDKLSLIMDN